MRVAIPALGLLAIASACVTSGAASPGMSAPSAPPRQMTPLQATMAQVDSTLAQQVANQVGPRASIRAEFANVSGVRRVVASFHLDDDAYVLVGHLDADGVVRIVFPVDPRDDGFVHGNRDYRTPEFFAGFTDEYRYRARTSFNQASRAIDSYDGSLGYAFIIASWRPLHVEQFATDGRWDTFELADDKYLTDPRPAIYEMAALLAGQNREAYTVEFARYNSTSALYAGYSGYGGGGGLGYGYGLGGAEFCNGYSPFGWGYSPFGSQFLPIGYSSLSGYPTSFYSRGQYFQYDQAFDCYRTGPGGGYPGYYGYYGYRTAGYSTPTNPTTPLRAFTPRDRAPTSGDIGVHTAPVARLEPVNRSADVPTPSPTYRQRGLITPDDPGTLPGRRTPTIDARSQVENHSRPSLSEMVSRRPQTPTDQSPNGSGWARAQTAGRTTNAQQSDNTPTARRAEPANADPRGYQRPQTEQRTSAPAPVDARQRQAPQTETRSAPPPVAREMPSRPAPEVRSAPPPQPSSPPPASPPASSSSSSGAGAPIRPSGPPTA